VIGPFYACIGKQTPLDLTDDQVHDRYVYFLHAIRPRRWDDQTRITEMLQRATVKSKQPNHAQSALSGPLGSDNEIAAIAGRRKGDQ
jgi:hypothetical protein